MHAFTAPGTRWIGGRGTARYNDGLLVDKDSHRARLASLAATIDDPEAGVHGPGTASWRINKEALNFFAAGRAALLQLAHPYVATAIDQHSSTRDDVRKRFEGTFANVFAMTFGPWDRAEQSARRVHNIHTRITGTLDESLGRFEKGHRYHANESSALLWVFATLVDSVIVAQGALAEPLSDIDKERYYADARRFATLFGIPDAELPASYRRFAEYIERTLASDELAVGSAARDMASFLLSPPNPLLAPVFAWYKAVTAALLPARFREPFGLELSRARRLSWRATVPVVKALYPRLPRQLRCLPGYLEAEARVGESRGLTRALDRAAIGALKFWPTPA